MSQPKLVIIGGGVIGLCAGYYAQKAGIQTLILDKHEEDNNKCSYGNAGMVVPSHFVPLSSPATLRTGVKYLFQSGSPLSLPKVPHPSVLYWMYKFAQASNKHHVRRMSSLILELNQESLELYKELDQTSEGAFHLKKSGMIMLCKTEKGFAEEVEQSEVAKDFKLETQILEGDELLSKEPSLTKNVVGGVLYPDDHTICPVGLLKWLKEVLVSYGGEIRQGVVARLDKKGDTVVVRVGNEVIESEDILLAGGTETRELMKFLGVRMPLIGGKGYSMTRTDQKVKVNYPAILVEGRVAVSMPGGYLRIGGTMELAGRNEVVQSRVDGIRKSVEEFYQGSGDWFGKKEPAWYGFRPCSPDGLPYLGRLTKHPKVIVATGHAMMGVSLGAITGKLVSQIIQDEKPMIPLHAMSPERYN